MDGTIIGSFISANSITVNQLAADVGQQLDISSNAAITLLVTADSLSTQLTQLEDSFTFDFNSLMSDIQTVDGNTTVKFTELYKYIRFVNGKIVLGEEGNLLTLELRNDRIYFLQSGAEVAYFSDNKLTVTDGHFLVSLRIGDFSFRPRSNGSLSFGKVV